MCLRRRARGWGWKEGLEGEQQSGGPWALEKQTGRALLRHCKAGSPVELLWRGMMPKEVSRERLTESLVMNHLVMHEAWAFQEACMAARGVSWWTSTKEGVETSQNQEQAANRSIKAVLGTLCQNQEGQSPAGAGTAQGHWWEQDRICRHAI